MHGAHLPTIRPQHNCACRDASKALEREREREAALESERRRQIRADLENIDPEDQVEPWARRPISGRCGTRRGTERWGWEGWGAHTAPGGAGLWSGALCLLE